MGWVWFVAALWLLLALVAVLVANWLRVSTALSEIVVGVIRVQKKVAPHEGTGA
jgi:Kef-type K+ transport system membrane component KefB